MRKDFRNKEYWSIYPVIAFVFKMVCPDDNWLELTPEALDEMMEAATGQRRTGESEELDLKNVADSMNAFVNKVSSVDGVEFPR